MPYNTFHNVRESRLMREGEVSVARASDGTLLPYGVSGRELDARNIASIFGLAAAGAISAQSATSALMPQHEQARYGQMRRPQCQVLTPLTQDEIYERDARKELEEYLGDLPEVVLFDVRFAE